MYKKFGEDRARNSEDMIADSKHTQTDRRAHHNRPTPRSAFGGGVMMKGELRRTYGRELNVDGVVRLKVTLSVLY